MRIFEQANPLYCAAIPYLIMRRTHRSTSGTVHRSISTRVPYSASATSREAVNACRNGSWLCKNALREISRGRDCCRVALWAFFRARLCPHRGHERLDTYDVHHAGEIVGQYMQCHF